MNYNYLIVGSGLYGATIAQQAKKAGKSVLVIDKRPNVGGNIYTEKVEGINVHKYGAHIFHTNNKEVWDYVTSFVDFNRFTNSPVANYKGELYSMPFNMYTFNKMWGVVTPEEAAAKIEEQKKEITGEPKNLEEQAISLVGRDIYEKLVKGYTEKQWGRDCKDLPAFIIKRLPVRLTFDNNYFNALYQGIPIGGYTKLIEKMLEGIEVRLNVDYLENKEELDTALKSLYVFIAVAVLMYLIYFFIEKSGSVKNSKEYGVYRAIGVNKGNLLFKETMAAVFGNLVTYLIGFVTVTALFCARYAVMNVAFGAFIGLAAAAFAASALIMVGISLIPYLFVLTQSPSEILSRYDI